MLPFYRLKELLRVRKCIGGLLSVFLCFVLYVHWQELMMPSKNTYWHLDAGKIKAETAQGGECTNRGTRTALGGLRFGTARVWAHL